MNRGALLAVGGIATIALLAGKRRPRRNPNGSSGLSLSDDSLELADWGKWMRFAPRAIQRAISEGASNAEQVTARVLYRAFPAYDWPPPANTELAKQWQKMVNLVAADLSDEKIAEIREGLRVVR